MAAVSASIEVELKRIGRNLLNLAVLGCGIVLGGCGQGIERVPVSGMVSFDGEPIEDGQISFEPLAEGKMEFGIITGGKYSIPKEYGLVPGEYLVRITGNRSTGKQAEQNSFYDASEGGSLDIKEQYIPLKFNSGSKLVVNIEAEEKLEKDFTITSE